MTNEEKKRILQMVADGTITPEEGNQLLEALDASETEAEADVDESEASQNPAFDADLKSTIEKIRSFWFIPLWIGIGLSLLGGWWMMRTMDGFGLGFYCAWLPFLLGVLMIAATAGTRRSRWLFVNIRQAPGERPQRIVFGLPLPLRFSAWLLRQFGHLVTDVDLRGVDDCMADAPSDEPVVVVDVCDDEADEHVQIFVG